MSLIEISIVQYVVLRRRFDSLADFDREFETRRVRIICSCALIFGVYFEASNLDWVLIHRQGQR